MARGCPVRSVSRRSPHASRRRDAPSHASSTGTTYTCFHLRICTLHSEPETRDTRPSKRNPEPLARNPKPETPDPTPQTLSPKQGLRREVFCRWGLVRRYHAGLIILFFRFILYYLWCRVWYVGDLSVAATHLYYVVFWIVLGVGSRF